MNRHVNSDPFHYGAGPGMQLLNLYPECPNLPVVRYPFNLILVQTGSVIFSADGNIFSVRAPALLCLSAPSFAFMEPSDNFRARALAFRSPVLRTADDGLLLQPFMTHHHISLHPVTAERLSDLVEKASVETIDLNEQGQPLASLAFLEILFLLSRIMEPSTSKNGAGVLPATNLHPATLYLLLNYQSRVLLPQLAAYCNSNRTTLENQFLKMTGQPVHAHLVSIRMELAALFLRNTHQTIQNCAIRVGFADSANFGRSFHKYFGCSPTLYRRSVVQSN